MGWFLGCFTCAGDPQQVKPKKQSSGVVNLVSGRANSAAVAHASSPDDLHRVRESPSNLAVDKSNRNGETGHAGHPSTLPSFFRPQAKNNEGANLGFSANEANKFNRERTLNGKLEDELESFKDRLIQKADTAQLVYDQVNDFRTYHSSELPPNFKSQLNKFARETRGQVQQSWMVSPLATVGGLCFETHSRLSSPFSEVYQHGSSYGRGDQASKSANFNDKLGISNGLKCPELNLFRVKSGLSSELYKTEAAPSGSEIQSPPWLFSDPKLDSTNHCAPHIFESSDLLLEHLDVSSLIEDSALTINWEHSSGELHLEQQGLSAKLPSVSSQRGVKSSQFSGHKNQVHLQKIVDGDFSDSSSSCSMVAFEVASEDDGPGLLTQLIVSGEGGSSSNGMPSEAQALSCDEEFIYAINMSSDAEDRLLQVDCSSDFEKNENESSPHRCFASQFRLSKCLCSSTRKISERDAGVADFSHGNSFDADEALLPCTHPNMHLLHQSKAFEDERHPLPKASKESSEKSYSNTRADCKECAGVHVDNHVRSSLLFQQESVEGIAFNGVLADPCMVTCLTGEEDGEERKKLRLEDSSSSFDRVQGSTQIAEDEQARLLSAAILGKSLEKSLEAGMDISVASECSALEQLSVESSHPQASNLSFISPSLSDGQMAMASYQSPALLALADDRPIIGTVAAHWSPVTPKKWWDGKGIPNSTNKYQEDQKVNWHAVPFEVRLEQALAKQDIGV